MMTRKDYIVISGILKRFAKDSMKSEMDYEDLVEEFVDVFELDNPHFKRFVFRKECGIL